MSLDDYIKSFVTDYIEDVEIAIDALLNMQLFPTEQIVCDIYAVPSHNKQAFYTVFYKENNALKMVYARTEIHAPTLKEPIKMYPFRYVKEVENNSAVNGRIVMGMKALSNDFVDVLQDVILSLPKENKIKKRLWIDGVFQAIRVYEGYDAVKKIAYKAADEIDLPDDKQYLSNILDELYLTIGNIIEG